MNLKVFSVAVAAMLLFGATGPAMAATGPSPQKTVDHTIPVLLKVNAQGKITSMEPAYKLDPQLQQRLHKVLDGMITQPAHDKNGNAIVSQLVMTMDIQTTPRANGTYNVTFSYVSAKPVPAGTWKWSQHPVHGKLALVKQGGHGERMMMAQWHRHRARAINQRMRSRARRVANQRAAMRRSARHSSSSGR